MSENGNAEVNWTSTSSENVEKDFPEIYSSTQEAVNEQIKGSLPC